MDAERALQAAILARLKAEPALKPWLGAAVRVWDQPPADPVFPYLLLGRWQTRPMGEGGALEHRLTLTCLSRYGGSEEAKAVVGLVRDCLDEAPLAPEGHRLVNLRVTYTDVFRGSDLKTTFGVVRLRAVTEAG